MSRTITLYSEVPSQEKRERFTMAIMGDSGVGKSTVFARILKHWVELANVVPKKERMGRRKKLDDFVVRGRDFTAEIVDTSLRYCSFPPRCDAFVLVYSLVNDKSFESVCAVREQILQQRGPDVPIVLVANKTDIADSIDKTVRSYRDFKIRCELGHGHHEISAEQDDSVKQVLEQIMKCYHKFISKGSSTSSVKSKLKPIKNFFSRK